MTYLWIVYGISLGGRTAAFAAVKITYLKAFNYQVLRISIPYLRSGLCWDILRDCRKSQIMAILAISHVVKSITYKHQIHRFRVFRQSLRITQLWQFYRYELDITGFWGFRKYGLVGDSAGFAKDMETTISGIASILRKPLKLTGWFCWEAQGLRMLCLG
jgi:hypothetical protein